MSRKLQLIIALLIISFSTNISAQEKSADTLSLNERAFIASKIYSSVQMYFAHWQALPRFDFDAAYKEYLERILKTEDRFDFDRATIAFMASLHNGHTGFVDQKIFERFGRSIGFTTTVIEGQWVVTQSDVGGLKSGDIITRVDDQTIEDFFQQNRQYTF